MISWDDDGRPIVRMHAAGPQTMADLDAHLARLGSYLDRTERLWQALTDPAFTRRYWGVQLLSEWRKGSPVTWEENGVVIADPEQVVLESDPPRRLAYTWHTFTPQWAAGAGIDDETLARLAGEPRSKVTFDVEPDGDQVRLTVVHSDFLPGSTVLEMVSTGWPRLLSDLKSLLEADEARSRHGG